MRAVNADDLIHELDKDGIKEYGYVSVFGIPIIEDCVPVVRCKDCKHCDITEVFDAKTAKSRQELFCMRYGMDIPGDWFCADGE